MPNERIVIDFTTTAGAYSIGDVIGSCTQIASNGFISPTKKKLISALLIDKDREDKQVNIHLFSDAPQGLNLTDNAAFSPTFFEMKKEIALITFLTADYNRTSTMSVASKTNLNIPVLAQSAFGNLYVAAETRAVHNFSSTQSLSLELLFGD